ncbi:hypothetical protein CDAR_47491 [Caerostris darwini]|uniref:Uncharacterized protein n=1 Tax=Caerostris darwini TaxID=1538125 RepID=A0AAV4M8C6_9ARAC|nr:hypothetical protein CDAR_47491 [Caerostris darwini]
MQNPECFVSESIDGILPWREVCQESSSPLRRALVCRRVSAVLIALMEMRAPRTRAVFDSLILTRRKTLPPVCVASDSEVSGPSPNRRLRETEGGILFHPPSPHIAIELHVTLAVAFSTCCLQPLVKSFNFRE